MNEYEILVTYVNSWQMDNNSGLTINYFMFGKNGEGFQPLQGTGALGQQRAKCSLPADKRSKISWVPGIYNAQMTMSIGSDGKPVLKVEDLDFVSRVSIKKEAEK